MLIVDEYRRLREKAYKGRLIVGHGVPPHGSPDETFPSRSDGAALCDLHGNFDNPADVELLVFVHNNIDALVDVAIAARDYLAAPRVAPPKLDEALLRAVQGLDRPTP